MAFFGGGDTFGKRPNYKKFTPESTAADALQINERLLPKAEELGGKVNTFNQAEMLRMLRAAIPGFDQLNEKQSEVIQSELAGEIPNDVKNQVLLRSISRAVSGGFGSSLDTPAGAGKNLEARDFGLTSLQLTDRALDSASRWTEHMARLTQPAMWNIGSAFVSGQDVFRYKKLLADVKASPDPAKRGNLDMKMSVLGMALGAYGGGAGYTQGASGGSGGAGAGSGVNDYVPRQDWDTYGTGASEGGGTVGGAAWGGSYGEAAGAGAFAF